MKKVKKNTISNFFAIPIPVVIVYFCWNWPITDLVHLRYIDLWEAIGMVLLFHALFDYSLDIVDAMETFKKKSK